MGNKVPNRVFSGHFNGIAAVGGVPLINVFNIPFTNREVKFKSLMLDMHFEIAVPPPLSLNIPEDDENLTWWFDVGSGVVGDTMTNPMVQTAGTFNLITFGERIRLFRCGQYFFDAWYVQHLLPMGFYISNLDPLNAVGVCATVVIEVEDVGII